MGTNNLRDLVHFNTIGQEEIQIIQSYRVLPVDSDALFPSNKSRKSLYAYPFHLYRELGFHIDIYFRTRVVIQGYQIIKRHFEYKMYVLTAFTPYPSTVTMNV